MKRFLTMCFLLLLLLFFHAETIQGTKTGLLLWYQTLIPSLLPFILITNALLETNAYEGLTTYFRHSGCLYEYTAILLGNLCGYPIGAKILSDFADKQYITPKRANELLSLSSQASPMFLIGYVYLYILEKRIPLAVFLASIYVPILVLYATRRKTETPSIMSPSPKTEQTAVSGTFLHAVQIMVMIGIYVIIFSIILCIVLPYCPHFQVPLAFMEITTGLKLLGSTPLSPALSVCFPCALSAFGGLCSAFQIKGILAYPEASIKKYLLDKMWLSAGTFLIILFYLVGENSRFYKW